MIAELQSSNASMTPVLMMAYYVLVPPKIAHDRDVKWSFFVLFCRLEKLENNASRFSLARLIIT